VTKWRSSFGPALPLAAFAINLIFRWFCMVELLMLSWLGEFCLDSKLGR